MNRDKWKTANEIFHAALDLPTSERDSYVSMNSAGDSEIEMEVRRLLKADSEAGSYLETPIVPIDNLGPHEAIPSPFEAGDVLKHRFKIIQHAGKGGMGYVFEAFDLDLKVRIALKAIRPEIAANPIVLDYFRREVRTARTITHANICRTFDFDKGPITAGSVSVQDHLFLTMEFLPGETLADRIVRDGRLSMPDAVNIARQIASGLDSAHEAGIIHRDIKPANIMLVPADDSGRPARAVIMDFGLARRDPLASAVEGSAISHGAMSGTLAYMAPEQLDSSEKVSPATDIYSFGLVLFEMVTGQRAFPSANLLSGIAQRLSGSPPSALALAPDLRAEWEAAIQGCLRIDPEQRFQAASQVIQVLDGGRSALAPESGSARPATRAVPPRQHRRLIYTAAAILIVAVSLSALWLRLHNQEVNPSVAPGALVYLTPVKNETGDKALNNLTELLQAGLSQSAQINLLDQSSVGDNLERMTKPPDSVIDEPTARHIALRTGAVRVIFANVTGSAGSYSLNIDIQQPDATGPDRYRDHWPKSFPWTVPNSTSNSTTIPPDLLSAVRKSTDWVRYEVGESKNDIARLDTPPEDVTTGNWEALEDFAQARRLLSQGQTDSAAILLKQAVAADTRFALAFALLGDVLRSLHRDIQSFQAYDNALDLGLQNRLTRREQDRIRGMRAVDASDFELAVDAFHDLAVNYPNDPSALTYPTVPLRLLNRNDEAIANLRRAISIDPSGAYAPYALAQELMIREQFDEVPVWIEYLKKHDHPGSASEDEAILLFLSHRYEQAAQLFRTRESSSHTPMMRSYSYQNLAALYADTGRIAEAIQTLDAGIADDVANHNVEQQSSKLLDRAYLECNAVSFESCLRDESAGFKLNPSPEHALIADTVLGLAYSAATPRFRAQVHRELEHVERSLPPTQFGTVSRLLELRTRGELELAEGHSAAALHTFEGLAAQDAPAGDREYLARAFIAVAATKGKSAGSKDLIRKAEGAYGNIALHPAIVLCDAMNYPPGYYRNQLSSYVALAAALHDDSVAHSHALAELEFLQERKSNTELTTHNR